MTSTTTVASPAASHELGSPSATAGAAAAAGAPAVRVCHTCQQTIHGAQFLRVQNYSFHKDHFTCIECSKPLQGTPFRTKDGKFYCHNDWLNLFCHSCATCGEKIATGNVVQACGVYYHPQHFVCTQCSKPFRNGKYYEHESKPYCEEDFALITLDKCARCDKPVPADEQLVLSDKKYHATCVVCCHCNVPLTSKTTIYQKDSRIYCREDYLNFFAKRCTACGDHIVKNCLSVNDEFYHPDCLKCSKCNVKLDQYICVEGHLRCTEHAEGDFDKLACSLCKKPIDDEVIRSAGKTVHLRCFKCAYCGTQLEKSTCKLREGNLCCPGCIKLRSSAVLANPPVSTPMSSSSSSSSSSSTLASSSFSQSSSSPTHMSTPSDGSSELRADGSPRDSKAKAPKPAKIDFKRGEMIGKGSFGKVYMAMNSATGELIAVKQVRLNTTEEQEQAIAIQNEIALMENLRHPNIVALLGTQRKGNKLDILMEYVPGKSIDSLLEKFGAFSEKVIRSYTRQLLEALAYCHANRVVHRDIKGKNILIDTKGNLKLADFGSAKRFQNVMSKDAPSLSYNYTPLWTAPEVLVGDYNSKVDVWSLGCVIIEMATAKPPWSEHNFENPFRALYHIGNSNSIPLIPPHISALGRDFILKCLCRDPDQRPTAEYMLTHEWVREIDQNADGPSTTHDNDSDADESSAHDSDND